MRLPGKVRKGDAVRAADYNDLLDFAASLILRSGVGYRVAHGPGGQLLGFRSRGAGALLLPCALGRTVPDGAGDVYLTPGQINAAGNNFSVGGDGQTFTPTIGNHIWAEVTLTGTLTDLLLDGGFDSSGGALDDGATVPDDHEWADDDESGKAYRDLGEWVDDGNGNPKWQGEGCGHVTFKYCAPNSVSATANSYRG